MRLFIILVSMYFVAGSIFVTIFGDGFEAIKLLSSRVVPFAMFQTKYLWYVLAGFAVLFFFMPRDVLLRRIPLVIIAFMGSALFYLTFNMIKKTLPAANSFYADPFFVGLDRMMHFGIDPWKITHTILPNISFETTDLIYYSLWVFPAMFFPIFLALFDGNEQRVNRFVFLHFFSWAILGGVFALLAMSGGPVFYERMYGDPYFADLMAQLDQNGLEGSVSGFLQDRLWGYYQSGDLSLGSGISAFPSVHVAMATVVGLYVFDRWQFLFPISIALVVTYQFLSVHLAWHYAVDGYFSILTLVGLWWWLRQREPAENVET